jgi:hypothetical protein
VWRRKTSNSAGQWSKAFVPTLPLVLLHASDLHASGLTSQILAIKSTFQPSNQSLWILFGNLCLFHKHDKGRL